MDFLPETGIAPDEVEGMLQAMGFRTDCLDRTLDNNLIFHAWRARRAVRWPSKECRRFPAARRHIAARWPWGNPIL